MCVIHTLQGGYLEGEGKCVFTGQLNQKHEFKGMYSKSYMSGFGTYNFLDGRIYRGEMRSDKMHGNGIFQWIEGYTYTGNWENGYIVGHGKFKLPVKGPGESRGAIYTPMSPVYILLKEALWCCLKERRL